MNHAHDASSKQNFHTASALLNLGIDHCFYKAAGLNLQAPREFKLAETDLEERFSQAKQLVQTSLPQLFWHSVELQRGRDNGFQLFMDSNWLDLDEYAARLEKTWNEQGVLHSADGEEFDLKDCPYFAKNCKTVTKASLIKAIKREEKTLLALLIKAEKKLELGHIHENGAVNYS